MCVELDMYQNGPIDITQPNPTQVALSMSALNRKKNKIPANTEASSSIFYILWALPMERQRHK